VIIAPHSLLHIKHRPTGGEFHQQRQSEKHRRTQTENGQGKDDIAAAFDHPGALRLQLNQLIGA
jgi:hypothetical protein